MAMSAMIWADPSANPVLSLAGGQPGLGGNFLHLGSDAVGKVLEAGGLPGSRAEVEEQAGPLSRLHPKARARRCRRATASSWSSTAPPATATRSGATPSASRATSPTARSAGVGGAPLRRGPRRRRRRRRRHRGPAGGDPRERLDGAAAFGTASASARSIAARSSCLVPRAASTSPSTPASASGPARCAGAPRPDGRELQARTRYRQRAPQTVDDRLYPIRRSSPRRSSCCASTRARLRRDARPGVLPAETSRGTDCVARQSLDPGLRGGSA